LQCARDVRGEVRGHELEDNRETARFFEAFCFLEKPMRRCLHAAQHAVSAQRMYGLRCQADVTHDWNAGANQRSNIFRGSLITALELYGLASRLLENRACVTQRFRGRDLETHEGHVHDEHGALDPAPDRFGVVDHVFERYGDRGVVAEDNLAKRISDQHNVGAAFIDKAAEEIVVRGETNDLVTALLHLEQIADSHAMRLEWSGSTHCLERQPSRMI
jgi:hypothetical protein